MRRTRKAVAAVVTAAAAVAIAAGAAPSALAAPAARPAAHRAGAVAFRPGSGQLVVDWNRELIAILGTPGAQPATVHPTRSFAILQAAEYDAVTSITRHDPSYLFSVFIDEIDALGTRRNASGLVGNDEREQTLNQLLAEMDGFEPSDGVIVLAATNRPDALDPALRRPGRFDREVLVPLPGRADRQAILTVHARGKNLEPDVDMGQVAAATPGFPGADLANLVNEAALTAIRAGRTGLIAADFASARDRVVLGIRDRSATLTLDELATVAVHEAGHALVATLSPHADPVSRVTILGAGRALGLTEQLPADDRLLYGERYLADALAVRLGGRAAELLIRGEASTGAADDLASATALATRMVREFGLSQAIGPVSYAGAQTWSFSGPGAPRGYSEHTQWLIDREVTTLLTRAEARARELLTEHMQALHQLTTALVEGETITGDQVRALVRAVSPPSASADRPDPYALA